LRTDEYKNGSWFTGSGNFSIAAEEKGVYKVTFCPQWIDTAEALLILTIPNTRDVFNYHLKGTGEEPCAKEHLILECRAR
jgi:hypothetical protein